MRHGKAGRKLNRNSSARVALARAQATALLREGRIQTTLTKAKELRPFVESLITTAKGGDLHSRRLIAQDIHDKDVVRKVMDEVAPKYAERPGGYTRIIKTTPRKGDNAPMAVIELVREPVARKAVVTEAERANQNAARAAAAPAAEETAEVDAASAAVPVEDTAAETPADATTDTVDAADAAALQRVAHPVDRRRVEPGDQHDRGPLVARGVLRVVRGLIVEHDSTPFY